MAKKQNYEKKTPQRAAAGGKGKAPETKKAAEAPTAADAITGGTDPSALIAKLVPQDVPGGLKTFGDYKKKVKAFDKEVENTSTARGDMNAKKKEMIEGGWEREALSLSIKMSKHDPDKAQRILAQTMVLMRSEHLQVPLGPIGLGVVDGRSVDLFDPERVYKFGRTEKKAAPLVDADKVVAATANGANGKNGNGASPHGQSREQQLKDLRENGFNQGVAARPGGLKIPKALQGDPEAVKAMEAGYARGQAQNMSGIKKKSVSRGVLKGSFH